MDNVMVEIDSIKRAHEEFTRMVGIEFNKLLNLQTQSLINYNCPLVLTRTREGEN